MRAGTLILSLLVFHAVVWAEEAQGKLNVFVAVATVDVEHKPSDAELRAKMDETFEVYEKFNTETKAQYGNKFESWPTEKKKESLTLSQNAGFARANYDYRDPVLKDLQGSVHDMIGGLGDKQAPGYNKNVSVVTSAEDAHLFVEVVGRQDGMATSLLSSKEILIHILCIRISAGKKLDPATFGKIPADWFSKNFLLTALTVKGHRPETPYFMFEIQSSKLWRHTGSSAANLIYEFINENYSILNN